MTRINHCNPPKCLNPNQSYFQDITVTLSLSHSNCSKFEKQISTVKINQNNDDLFVKVTVTLYLSILEIQVLQVHQVIPDLPSDLQILVVQ